MLVRAVVTCKAEPRRTIGAMNLLTYPTLNLKAKTDGFNDTKFKPDGNSMFNYTIQDSLNSTISDIGANAKLNLNTFTTETELPYCKNQSGRVVGKYCINVKTREVVQRQVFNNVEKIMG